MLLLQPDLRKRFQEVDHTELHPIPLSERELLVTLLALTHFCTQCQDPLVSEIILGINRRPSDLPIVQKHTTPGPVL